MFILSIKNSPGSVEGSGYQQMMPKLENIVFSAKSTQYVQLKRHKEPYNTAFETYKRGLHGNRIHTHTQNDYRTPRACTKG